LTLSSEKEKAKTFKRWITHEVIPSIRKTGSYSVNPSSVDEIKALYELMLPSLERAQAKPKELVEAMLKIRAGITSPQRRALRQSKKSISPERQEIIDLLKDKEMTSKEVSEVLCYLKK
jgi:prophage antirepressor-like protein